MKNHWKLIKSIQEEIIEYIRMIV